MKQLIKDIFLFLDKEIQVNHNLYLVGGSSRDYLLNKEFDDFDFSIDVPIDEISPFFKDCDKSFIKYGNIDIKYKEKRITLTCFRKELNYIDHRHPKICFTNDLLIDSKRRDFTINSIYISKDFNIIDPNKGVDDLNNKIIRMIGDISTRISEDPLRILRAYRFKYSLNFEIENELYKYIESHLHLLKLIRKEKIEQELNKFSKDGKIIMIEKLQKENII